MCFKPGKYETLSVTRMAGLITNVIRRMTDVPRTSSV